jgi:ribosomal-protein-alanine N-acetyltransferase
LEAAASYAASLDARALFLEVGADNPAALALYASLGFDRVGQRKAYYGTGDAWVLKVQLPLSPGGKFA